MKFKIAVIKGDGIGPEVIDQGIRVLKVIEDKFGHSFQLNYVLAGGSAIDMEGIPLPQSTLEACKSADAVLLGAVGGAKWDILPGDLRPERALLGLRKGLGLYANIRPAILYKELEDSCPLKKEIIGDGIDICVVRELTGGIYFGEKSRREGINGLEAYDVELYTEKEIERIGRTAFEIAAKRGRRLMSIDKANVLESSRLWRSVMERLSEEYPKIELSHMYVDNAAMQLIRNPRQFDVIVTNNIFGDILSDEASMITGSIGMLPSASLGAANIGMYEPIHGSAPDIAGQNLANPIAAILSVAMMLRYTFNLENEARDVEEAIKSVLEKGYRTGDIMVEGMKLVGTKEMGDLIIQVIKA
jgi:3-isopropylmalate dehydrogenase